MTTALTFLILIAPFAVAAALSWAAHRSGSLRLRIDQVRMAGAGDLAPQPALE